MKIKLTILASVVMAGILAGCTVPQVIQQPDGTTTTNQVADPKLITGLNTARAVNAATAPVNPYSPLVEIGLGLATVAAGWVAKRKNDKASANELLLKTVVQAIDALDDSKVKDAVQAHASRVGVEGELNTVFKKVSSGAI